MAGEDGRRCWSRIAVAVILVLCSLAQSSTCFSLPWLFKEVDQDKVVNEATVMEVKDGSTLFNGKDLPSQSGSASVSATENEGLLHTDLDQLDATGVLEQTSQLENAMANEAAWRHLKPTLHCGRNQMKLKAMGPGAANLQLDMGNARLLPLNQVPETCNFLMKRNSLGLVLVVPYNGCNVIQEGGNYVLPMSWLETPVKLSCPILNSYATLAPKPAQQPWKLPFPHSPWRLNRHKRQANQPLSIYDPRSPYYPYLYYYNYYMNMMTPAPAPSTTTAKPDMTTMTTKSSTENSQTKPPANPYPLYYPYLYYLYYPYYYPLLNAPVTTTTPTTTKLTSGPTTSAMTTTAMMTSTTSGSTTTAPSKTTQKPLKPYYPPYFPYPYYPPAGQQFPGMPDDSDIYYYQVVQHYYGKPPYPQIPNVPMQTTPPPTTTKPVDPTTTKPVDPTTTKPVDPTTTKPVDPTTTKPADPTTTTKPTTISTSTSTCDQTNGGVCTTTKPSSDKYPGPMSPYVPYNQLPFVPYISYKSNKAGKLPEDQKYIQQAGYKSGLQARAHPPPHPGFHYWQPVPWFPYSTGQDDLQYVWKKNTA